MTDDQKQPLGTAIRKESKPFPGNPWKGDVLGSKKIAEKLTNAVEDAARIDVDNAYVIGLHGEWGTGKTFLLENWCKELKLKRNPPCVAVYYNAWEDDFLANPLVAIIARLKEMMSKMKEFRSATKKLVSIAKTVSKIAHACGGVDVAEIISNAKEEMDKSGNTDEVNRYLELRKETDDLKGNLRDVAKIVKKETSFPLVFVIDELDRCRPVFALEVLERVKHLFNVPGVVFVLGFNKAGLMKSIEKVYGYGDAQSERYLRRFFDREVSMPFSKPEDYYYHLLRTNGVDDCFEKIPFFVGEKNFIMRFSVPMTSFWELTLREVESLVKLLSAVFNKEKWVEDACKGWVQLTLCLIFLKVKNPALYLRVVAREFNCKDLIDEMMGMFCNEKNMNIQHRGELKFCQDHVERQIYRLAGESEWNEIMEQLETVMSNASYDEPYPACPALAERTMEFMRERVGQLPRTYSRVSVKNITSLIELHDVK